MRGHLQGSLHTRAACLSSPSRIAAARYSVMVQRSTATHAPCSSDKLRGKNRMRAENPLNSGPCGNLWSGSCGWSRALIVVTLGTGIAIPLTVVVNADYVRTLSSSCAVMCRAGCASNGCPSARPSPAA